MIVLLQCQTEACRGSLRYEGCLAQVNRWLSVRLELMGVGIIFGTAVVVTIFPTNAGLAGLALTAALNLTGGRPCLFAPPQV